MLEVCVYDRLAICLGNVSAHSQPVAALAMVLTMHLWIGAELAAGYSKQKCTYAASNLELWK